MAALACDHVGQPSKAQNTGNFSSHRAHQRVEAAEAGMDLAPLPEMAVSSGGLIGCHIFQGPLTCSRGTSPDKGGLEGTGNQLTLLNAERPLAQSPFSPRVSRS